MSLAEDRVTPGARTDVMPVESSKSAIAWGPRRRLMARARVELFRPPLAEISLILSG